MKEENKADKESAEEMIRRIVREEIGRTKKVKKQRKLKGNGKKRKRKCKHYRKPYTFRLKISKDEFVKAMMKSNHDTCGGVQ